MKANVFYIYLSLLLLLGGNYLYADTHHNPSSLSLNQNLQKNNQFKHLNSGHYSVLKESFDIEVDEEFHTNDELNDNGANNSLTVKQNGLESWYLTFFRTNLFKDYSNNFKIDASFSVHSNPIYLIIGVFRI